MQINPISDINNVIYERQAKSAENEERAKPEKLPDYDTYEGRKVEKCTADTDKADREIEALKKKRTELEKQLTSCSDERKVAELERKLANAENELRMKDNNSYRRSKTVFKTE